MIATKLRIGRATPASTLFFLCDMQQDPYSRIYNIPRVEQTCIHLSKAANLLDIPVIVTEHDVKSAGRILDTLKEVVAKEKSHWFEKMKFSMHTDEVSNLLKNTYPKKKSAVVFGIEAHVCVQQTVLDLLGLGLDVHVVADAVSSQNAYDREISLRRMEEAGAFLSTTESILLELVSDSLHPKFGEVSPMFKEPRLGEFMKIN